MNKRGKKLPLIYFLRVGDFYMLACKLDSTYYNFQYTYIMSKLQSSDSFQHPTRNIHILAMIETWVTISDPKKWNINIHSRILRLIRLPHHHPTFWGVIHMTPPMPFITTKVGLDTIWTIWNGYESTSTNTMQKERKLITLMMLLHL